MLTAGCRFAHKEFKQLSRDLRRIGGERLNGGLQSDRASRYANLMTFRGYTQLRLLFYFVICGSAS